METVLEVRDRLQTSLQKAKAIVWRRDLKIKIEEAKTVDDLKPILLELLEHQPDFC